MGIKWLFEDPSTIINARFRLLDEVDGDGGAGSDGGDQSQAGEQSQQQQPVQGEGEGDQSQAGAQREPGAQGRRQHQSQMVPYGRFQEVNRGYQSYRGFGTPAEIRAKLDRLSYLEKNPVNRYTPDQENEIREDLLRLFPQLRTLQQTDETMKASYVAHGSRQNPDFVKQLGWESNDNNHQLLEDILGGVISRNPELRQRFFARDPGVFADAFKVVKPIFGAKANRQVPGLNLVKGKTPASGPGNISGKKPGDKAGDENKPKPGSPLFEREVLDQASEAAFDLISSREE